MAALLCGCKGKQVVAPQVEGEVVLAPMAELQPVDDQAEPWANVYLPFKLSASAQGEMSVSGRALMVKDQAIYLSFRMMGIEGATLLLNSDSVYFVDKYHKLWLAESKSALLGSYDLSVGDVQSLLLGRAFTPSESMSQICWGKLADGSPLLQAAMLDMPGMASGECFYFDPAQTPHGAMASLFDFTLWPEADDGDEAPLLQLTVEWGMGDAKWNTDRQVKFSPPKGYGSISIGQLAAFIGTAAN